MVRTINADYRYRLTELPNLVLLSGRRPWFNKFRAALSATKSVEEIEHLVHIKIARWRGRSPRCSPNLRETEDSATSGNTRNSGLLAEDIDLSVFQ
jgi:tRNA-dihydrouridine synthase 1